VLANLIEGDTLPLFVPEAIVEHAIPLSLMECLRKDIRTAYLEGTNVREDRLDGSSDSSDAERAPAIAVVHVEDCQPAFDRYERLGLCWLAGRLYNG